MSWCIETQTRSHKSFLMHRNANKKSQTFSPMLSLAENLPSWSIFLNFFIAVSKSSYCTLSASFCYCDKSCACISIVSFFVVVVVCFFFVLFFSCCLFLFFVVVFFLLLLLGFFIVYLFFSLFRFYEARETTQRMNMASFNLFRAKVHAAANAFNVLKALLIDNVQEKIQDNLDFIVAMRKDMIKIIESKLTIYKYQKYSLQKNFMRARDAMEERTFSTLCFGFHEHVFKIELMLNDMSNAMDDGNREVAIALYTILINSLQTRIETARKAYANYTQLYTAYETGDRIFNYKFKSYPRKYNSYINPRPLLNNSLRHNGYAIRYAPRVGEDILRVMNATLEFQNLVVAVFENKTKQYVKLWKK